MWSVAKKGGALFQNMVGNEGVQVKVGKEGLRKDKAKVQWSYHQQSQRHALVRSFSRLPLLFHIACITSKTLGTYFMSFCRGRTFNVWGKLGGETLACIPLLATLIEL